ncbi:hypothetical protein VTK73DRAFT_3389 [Phialemonium thermophilum]|uniref:NAD-dependent epimerase/dehydratase domain-containing protein n=1 Tax=Phialemonium thermophilum TaxID=223376 RepID=A0ABR3X067_9PEZI
MSAVKRLVVCGGNGFVGSRICRSAVARGWDVISISRSGEPHWDSVTSSSIAPSWAKKVSWQRANIFVPQTYVPYLKGADYVVHSMGILLEADYKGVISGRESPIAGLRKAFSPAKGHSTSNPLQRRDQEGEQSIRPPESAAQLTYEMMNRDSAVLLAKEADREGCAAFAYMSAAAGAPVLPSRYISTKREAEDLIAREFPRMRGVFVRAPFMYDPSRPVTMAMAGATAAGAIFNGLTRGALSSLMGAGGVKPLKADVVADAVVEALADENVKGPVEVPKIEELADKSWRRTML